MLYCNADCNFKILSTYFSAFQCLGRDDLGQPGALRCFVGLWLTGVFC